jgi:hypothetical protein
MAFKAKINAFERSFYWCLVGIERTIRTIGFSIDIQQARDVFGTIAAKQQGETKRNKPTKP